MKVTYIIGIPAAGKSSLVSAATENYLRFEATTPFATEYICNQNGDIVALELGKQREKFSGTDALAMNVMPKACNWVQNPTEQFNTVIGEGDRLASKKFFEACINSPNVETLNVIHLQVSNETAQERRKQRGSNQNETWLKSRETKVQNLQEYVTHSLNAEEPLQTLVKQYCKIAELPIP